MPSSEDGPAVRALTLSPTVKPGSVGRSCSGVAAASTTSVALALDQDVGFWVVAAGAPDVSAPGFPTFSAEVAFSRAISKGRRSFTARAIDSQGRFGAAFTRVLEVDGVVRSRPQGRLVVALSWDTQADLDLHLVDPKGVEIWKRNINSYERPAGAATEPPGTLHPGGILDFDSNAQCVPDGRSAENVVYADAPPSGHYVARVDTFALCRDAFAHWRLEAFVDDVSVGAAEGTSANADTTYAHDRGAGVRALEFDVP